jgi:hypothetical protein
MNSNKVVLGKKMYTIERNEVFFDFISHAQQLGDCNEDNYVDVGKILHQLVLNYIKSDTPVLKE